MARYEDLTGRRFGRLVVTKRIIKNNKGFWLCVCDCGKIVLMREKTELLSGRRKSCGCYNRDRITKHGDSYSALYSVWHSMKVRCYTKTSIPYKNYGGRGITVCEKWRNDYTAFRDWALGHGYAKGLTLDRIDNNGNYTPENCRFVDMRTQSNNRRSTRHISYKGITQSVAEWGRTLGVRPELILDRLKKNWPLADALSATKYKPLQHKQKGLDNGKQN